MAKTHSFHAPRAHGFVRVAAATPVVHVADPAANAEEHARLIRQAGEADVDLLVFPELSLSAYAIDDLLMQAALLEEVERQVAHESAARHLDSDRSAGQGGPSRHGGHPISSAVTVGASTRSKRRVYSSTAASPRARTSAMIAATVASIDGSCAASKAMRRSSAA